MIKTVYTKKETVKEMIGEIREKLKDSKIKFIIYFVSSQIEQEKIAVGMKNAFPDSEIIGCSSAGEMISGQVLEKSLVVMAFEENALFDIKTEIIPSIREDNGEGVKKAFKTFEDYYQVKARDMDFDKYLGIILFDWMATSEEKTMEKLGGITNVGFIGCSAADNLNFTETFVHMNEKIYQNAAILALLKPKRKFHFVKTQNFCQFNKRLKVTKADPSTRTVMEFDNKPATEAYAESLGVRVDDLENKFFEHPVGLDIGDDFLVRSPQAVSGTDVVFFCNMLEGQNVHVLKATDIIEDTKNVFEEQKEKLPSISGVIDFHCILRTLDLRKKGITKEYGEIFKDVPMIGLASYGQQFIGHIDQTSMLLIFE